MDQNFFAAGVIDSVTLDLTGNAQKVQELSERAMKQGYRFLAFPELCLPGPDCADVMDMTEFAAANSRALLYLKYNLPEGITVGVGAVLQAVDGRVYDTYVLLKHGQTLGLAAVQSFSNSRDFRIRNMSSVAPDDVFILGTDQFNPTNVFDVEGQQVGVYFNDSDQQAVAQSQLVVCPVVNRYELGNPSSRLIEATALSAILHTKVLTVSLCGCDGSSVYDGLCSVTEEGKLLASSAILSFDDLHLFTAKDGVAEPLNSTEEVLRAVGLGLFDWLNKTRSKGFAVSLSGGADSALTAVAVCYSQLAALKDLGAQRYQAKLAELGIDIPLPGGDPESFIKKEVMPKVLTTVYQSTKVSGESTRKAAAELAACLGSCHYEWSVQSVVDSYIELAAKATGSQPDNDLALQNIQSRSRAPGVWLLANQKNQLLLTCCNSSEEAVGYCTMDGDTAGSLAPLGGISKSRILKMNEQIAKNAVRIDQATTLSVPAMSLVNAQAPSAELKPGQTDEADLMPYAVLDRIHYLHQLTKRSPQKVLNSLALEFGEYSREQLKEFVTTYFTRLGRSQWKRARGAPVLHIEAQDLSSDNFKLPLLGDAFASLLTELS